MILGLYQSTSPAGDLSKGIDVVADALSRAAVMKVDMLVLPEAFLPGYCATPATPPDGWHGVEAKLSKLCQDHGVALTIGLPDYVDDVVYNTALCLDADGQTLARHCKLQLYGPDEKALYTPGDAYCTFDYRGKRFGILICYDVEFPEHVRALAALGAEVILVPTANMQPFVNVNQLLVPARAAENGVSIVYANYCGSEGVLDYVGMSAIYGPDGYHLGTKGMGEGLCIAELPDGDWSEHGIPLATQRADFRSVN